MRPQEKNAFGFLSGKSQKAGESSRFLVFSFQAAGVFLLGNGFSRRERHHIFSVHTVGYYTPFSEKVNKKIQKTRTIPCFSSHAPLSFPAPYHFQPLEAGIRTPSRDKLVAISFGIGLSLDEVNELMKISCNRPLYSRDKRDAVIIYGISNGLDISKVNDILYEKGIDIIE